MNIECWFCGKKVANENSKNNIIYSFEKKTYRDKVKMFHGEKVHTKKKKLVIGRCDDCYKAHLIYQRMSLLSVFSFIILAVAFFLLFRSAENWIVVVFLSTSILSFGLIVFFRSKYLANRGIKALVELGMKNEEIQKLLADGWHR